MDETRALILGEIRQVTGIDAGKFFDMGLIQTKHARKWMVRRKYFELAKTGRTYTDIKLELSVEYEVSVSAIEKMIYRK
jgi:hypothetical protein